MSAQNSTTSSMVKGHVKKSGSSVVYSGLPLEQSQMAYVPEGADQS